MLIVFGILIVLASVLLGFFVLIQNPKGGGLAGNLGGFGNQVMGVRQTTDVLEKGTWILSAIILVLCLTSYFFAGSGTTSSQNQPFIPTTKSAPAAPVMPGTTPATRPASQPVPQQQPSK
ncbi:preprotein translocase subunit SecG [Chitinophaga costaii]|uniref:Protein-export membrane protein SecG n=1 Tax=Chitinophaga costaii TaxID=1335309 RepID=A0A1C4EQT5_9BACT|nr:preprotein translocase subunit SecG [Chitinophaga costaii]PUZ22530.1 preprotein translocase subunit SecG [Chitinophaga costaii]SCC45988.1 preprotein translocase subunit SecG [Chitinophaga costaii]